MLKSNGKPLCERDRLKYRIAAEMGLMDIIFTRGWGGLTAGQAGRLGAQMRKRMAEKER